MTNCKKDSLKVGDIAITTCRIDNMIGHIEPETTVKIIKITYDWYDVQTDNGEKFLLVHKDCLEKRPTKV